MDPNTSAAPIVAPHGDQGGQRVDNLFTEAIERQVAEQRNLNRLLQEIERSITDVRGRVDELQSQVAREVGPTFDRLAAVDAAVTALRENSAAQSVAARAEVQELIESLRGDVRGRSERHDESLTAVRQIEDQLNDRLGGIARSVEAIAERLTARQDSFGQDLQRLISRVTDIGESSDDTRDLLGPQGVRFEEAANGAAERVQSAIDRQIQRMEQIEGRWSGFEARFEQLQQQMTRPIDELRSALAEQVETGVRGPIEELGHQQEELRQQQADALQQLRDAQASAAADAATSRERAIVAAAEAQERALDQVREAQRVALEELAQGQQGMLEGLAEQVRTATTGVTAELGEIEAVAARMNQSRMLDEDSRGVLRNELLEDLRVANDVTVGKLRDRIEDGFAALRDRIVHQLGELDERVAGANETVAGLSAGQDERLAAVSTDIAGLGTRQDERLAVVSTDIAGLGTRQDERLAIVSTDIAELGTRQDERLAVVSTDIAELAKRLDALTGQSVKQQKALGAVTEDLGSMGDTLGRVLGEMQTSIVAVQEQGLADVRATLAEAEDRLGRSRELLEGASAQVEGAATTLGDHLQQALAEVALDTRKQTEQSVAEVGVAADRLARTSESVRALEGSMVEYLQARDRRFEEQRMAVLGDLVRQLGDHLSRRDRKRIAERLDLAQAVNAPPPRSLVPSMELELAPEPAAKAPQKAVAAPQRPSAPETRTEADVEAEVAAVVDVEIGETIAAAAEAPAEAPAPPVEEAPPAVDKAAKATKAEVIRTRGRTRATPTKSPRHDLVRELEALTKAALYDRAKALRVPGRSGMSRESLIEAIADREL